MSSSDPPRSRVAQRVRDGSHAGVVSSRRTLRRRMAIKFAAAMRWLHIYLSMFSLAIILFFSLTGITLNHPTWFASGAERSVEAEGKLNVEWLRPDPAREVKKLEVVEYLRRAHRVRGALADFRVDERECTVSFKGPGYAADAFIDRETGGYRLTETSHGLIAVINDLHKGRDTGPGWSLVIDLSAVLMTIVSLTGLILLFYLKLRRKPGLVVILVGTIAAAGAYWVLVP